MAASHDADPNLFSSYAAVNAAGTAMTLLVLNKNPNNGVQTAFALNGFVPSQVTTYTLSKALPTQIVCVRATAMDKYVELAGIFRNPAGYKRKLGQDTDSRVGLESGHHHGSIWRNGNVATKDYFWFRNRDAGIAAIG